MVFIWMIFFVGQQIVQFAGVVPGTGLITTLLRSRQLPLGFADVVVELIHCRRGASTGSSFYRFIYGYPQMGAALAENLFQAGPRMRQLSHG